MSPAKLRAATPGNQAHLMKSKAPAVAVMTSIRSALATIPNPSSSAACSLVTSAGTPMGESPCSPAIVPPRHPKRGPGEGSVIALSRLWR
jgi:hypothetical protein